MDRQGEAWQHLFYRSKAWRAVRARAIARDRYICAGCGQVITDVPQVHHTVELTAVNVSDPAVSLNLALLETLCVPCHNAKHGRFGHGADKETIVGDDLEIDYERRCAFVEQ